MHTDGGNPNRRISSLRGRQGRLACPLQSQLRAVVSPLFEVRLAISGRDVHLAKTVDRFALAEILELEHLADFDFALMHLRVGKRLANSSASSLDFTWMIA